MSLASDASANNSEETAEQLQKGTAVAAAPSRDIWVAGFATSTNFPLVNPLMRVGGGNGPSVFRPRYSFQSAPAPGPLQITLADGEITLNWSGGTLQQADSPAGPFQDVTGAAAPYSGTVTSGARFYRVR